MSDKEELLAKTAGAIKEWRALFGDRVLVATYVRPEKTKGGIYMVDKTREEDLHQGKTGLVIALGQHAFKDKDYWGGNPPTVGDWVAYNIQDTRRLVLVSPDAPSTADARIECRIMPDTVIQGIVDDPTVVY